MRETMNAYLARLQATAASGNLPIQLYRRAADNPTSLDFAVHAQCIQCSHGTDEEGWMESVRDCKASRCQLNPIRPYQNAEGRVSRRKKINAYCWQCMGGCSDGRSGTNGNIRKLINECDTFSCFLHTVRPYQDWCAGTDPDDSVTDALTPPRSRSDETNADETVEDSRMELSTA